MKYRVTLHGKIYEVEVERSEAILLDEYEALRPQQAETAPEPKRAKEEEASQKSSPAPVQTGSGTAVNAPMPGNILDVKVRDGASVKEGDILCVLEAMKMENDILAPHDGRVTVLASKGMVVDTGDPLFTVG